MARLGRTTPSQIVKGAFAKIVGTNWLGDSTIAGTGTVTTDGVNNAAGNVVPVSGVGAITVSGSKGSPGDSTVSGVGAVSASGSKVAPGDGSVGLVGAVLTTGQITAVGISAVSGVGSVAAGSRLAAVGQCTLVGTGSVAASALLVALGQTTVVGTGTVAATGIKNAPGSTTVPGTGSVSSSGTKQSPGDGSIVGTGSVAPAGVSNVLGNATVPGTGAVAATGIKLSPATVTPIAGTGTITIVGGKLSPGDVAVPGTGAVATSGTKVSPASTTVTGTGAVASSGTKVSPATVSVPGTGAINAKGVSNVLGRGTVTGVGAILARGGLNSVGQTTVAGVGSVVCYGTVHRPLPHPAGFPDPVAAYPAGTAIVAHQMVSIHTISGVQLYDYLPSTQFSLKWGRSLRQVSKAALSAPSTLNVDILPDLVPWLHWMSVWNDTGTSLLWTGPIQTVTSNRNTIQVSAADIGAYLARTRVPITKDWDAADPSQIASEMWRAMIANHGLRVQPIVRVDPEGQPFDYQAVADLTLLDQTMKDLVQLGLSWSVVAGIPILGPAPLLPFTVLSENDFTGADGVTITRDGVGTFNDVLVHAADGDATARVELGGLNLQTVVNASSIFGIDNADKAAVQYARYSAQIRDTVTLNPGSNLHPDAPLTIEQLIPSARIALEAYGLRTTQQIDNVDVSSSTQGVEVALTLETAVDILTLPELARPSGRNGLQSTQVSTAP